MLRPSEAIELLIAAGVARVDLNNEQPHRPKINLAMTIEAQAAELISHYQRRVQELLEANNRYLDRARAAEAAILDDAGWIRVGGDNSRQILSLFAERRL